MILFLVAFTALFQPAAPTVGDPVTVRFPAPVTLEADASYEIVSVSGATAVVRTFAPQPMVLRGTSGDVKFRRLVIPVRSVLPRGGAEPAPLAPPRELPPSRAPLVAIACAALLAAALWTLAWRSSRVRTAAAAAPVIPPHERFARAVAALRDDGRRPLRWAALADETRRYLAATRPGFGSQLTTTELFRRLRGDEELLRTILTQGDLEKFSPWGPQPLDFEAVAVRALALADAERPAVPEAA